MTITEAIAAVDRMAAAFPLQGWDTERRDVWAVELGNVNGAHLERAVDELVATVDRVTLAQVLAHVTAAAIDERRRSRWGPDRDGVSKCRGGCDHGWHWEPDSAKPCFACRPELFERWVGGEFDRPATRGTGGGARMPVELAELRALLRRTP